MTAPVSPRAPRTTLVVSLLGFFLITLDILIVNLALPSIRAELGGGTVGQQWVIDSYTLTFAALLLFAGTMSERFGSKKTFAVGVIGFTLASAACAFAPALGVLIAARFGQGVFAALMLPASMALIRETYPDPARRARALGIWAVGGAVAAAAGPLLGGTLTTVDWRLVFLINLPVGVVMVFLLPRIAASPTAPAHFDVPGQLSVLLGLSALVFALIDGGEHGFGSIRVIVALSVAVVALLGFFLIQARSKTPMMPLGLLRPRGMQISLAVGFTFMVGWYGTVFVCTLQLQEVLGLDPLSAGLAFLPSALVSIGGNLLSGPLTTRFGARVPVLIGLGSMVLGLATMVVTAPLGSALLTTLLIIPVGAGGSIAMPAITSVVLDEVPNLRAGTASAIFNTFRQVGGAVGIAVFGALISDRANFVPGMQVSLTVAAILVAGAFAYATRIRRPVIP